MRLKPICASIMLLGLTMSGSALAATHHNKKTSDTDTVSVQNQLNAMQSQMNQLEQVINQNNGGTQSMGGTSLQSKLANSSDWYNAITVSGLINADGIYSNRTPVTAGSQFSTFGANANTNSGAGSSTDFALSNVDLFVDAQVNSWTKAHIGLNYESNESAERGDSESLNIINDSFTPVIKDSPDNIIDEAYVTIGNFCENPFYARVGKQYVNFGNYDRFAAVPTLTQLLTQTNEAAVTVGFVNQGLYGSVYGFRGTHHNLSDGITDDGSRNVNNAGANVGFAMQNNGSGFNAQVGYLNNMADVDFISHGPDDIADKGSRTRVGAMSLDISGNMGMFDANAHYVSALGDFSEPNFLSLGSRETGARPSAMTLGTGVTFPVMDHSSRAGVSYQHSWQAEKAGLYAMPEVRYEATYNVNVSKNVNVGLDVFRDEDYGLNNGGTDRAATTGVVRLGVMFA